jgi:hypothetical protein
MVLFDAAIPPLTAAAYRMTARAEVTVDGAQHNIEDRQELIIEAPRFAFGPEDVAGVSPPPGAEGPFENVLPQVLLRRRTLPWERHLDPANLIPQPARPPGSPPDPGRPPWMALLVFREDECEVLRDVPLAEVVPPGVMNRLGAAADTRCDAVRVDRTLLQKVLPSKDELTLLAHVRWVNVDDRELGPTDSDGFFAVVASNRLPDPGATSWACLVSLEERADIVPANPPPLLSGDGTFSGQVLDAVFTAGNKRIPTTFDHDLATVIGTPLPSTVGLVLLHSWRFTCEGTTSFRQLAQALDVGLLGTVDGETPRVTDTGHLPISLRDRVGVAEPVLYRGPLVPYPLTRDPLGPYQSADQARRVSPETGVEDISYAAAFEVGRLLAVSDGRFRDAASRWRRVAYQEAARQQEQARLVEAAAIPAALLPSLPVATAQVVGASLLARVAETPTLRRADARELSAIRSAPGLEASALAATWNIEKEQAAVVLGPMRVLTPEEEG